jgi:hypothetical protein
MTHTKYIRICALLLFFVFGLLTSAKAQDMPIPIETQVKIFKKIFQFNLSFRNKRVTVIVAYSRLSAGIKDEIVAAFKEQGFPARAVPSKDLEKYISKARAVYIAPGVSAVDKLCKENGVLSITGVPSMVQSGKASVGLGTQNGKPRIFIHKTQSLEENQELSDNLLRLARVIQ